MATNKLQWKRIAKGDKLPCQSFLRKKDGEILKLSTVGGVEVGQDAYYLPVDEVINVIKDYPVEESEDEKVKKAIYNCVKWFGFDSCFFKDVSQEECLAWLEKQGEQKPAEWSEEDENLLKLSLENLTELKDRFGEEHGKVGDCIVFLESIKDRIQHQTSWKPSDEMLEALYRAIPENVMEISEDEMLLDKLYQGLKYGRVLSNK